MATLRRGAAVALLVAAVVVPVVLLTRGKAPHHPHVVTPAPAPAVALGANVGPLFNGQVYGPAQVDAQLSALAATGATLARSDAPWEASEPQPPSNGVHHYDWAFDDTVAGALAAHHLRWLPVLGYSATWARSVPGRDHSAPTSAGDYAAYAAAFAARYGSGGSFWRSHPQLAPVPVDAYEIWNEPDSVVFWYPKPNAAVYAGLYLAARAAIKAVEPGAAVIVGGLAHASTFIPQLVAAAPQLGPRLDGVAIHPYGPNPPAVLANVRSTRSALAAAGLGGVPLYVTEFGWATRPPGALHYLPESLRPTYIEQTLSALGHLDCDLAAVLLYSWITTEANPLDANDWFGIVPPGGGDTPDMQAFTQGLHAAAAPAAPISCS